MSSKKQDESRCRNFRVFRLRGLYHTIRFYSLSNLEIKFIQDAVDRALIRLNAETESLRVVRRQREWDEKWGKMASE